MTDATETPEVVRNDDAGRYELRLGDTVAGFTEFRANDEGTLVFPHTEVDKAYGGRGYGSILVEGAVKDVAARGESIAPVCPFVIKYLRENEVDGLSIDWSLTIDE